MASRCILPCPQKRLDAPNRVSVKKLTTAQVLVVGSIHKGNAFGDTLPFDPAKNGAEVRGSHL